MTNLTPRQQRFADEYLIDLNGTQAAIRAGYSKRTAAQQAERLLRNAQVRAAVDQAIDARAERTQIAADAVLVGIRRAIARCEQAVPVLDAKGGPVMIETPNGKLAAAYKFDAANALRGYELLGKHLKLFNDKIGPAKSIATPPEDMTPEQRLAEIRQLLAENPQLLELVLNHPDRTD